jgi:hypothetical protein
MDGGPFQIDETETSIDKSVLPGGVSLYERLKRLIADN